MNNTEDYDDKESSLKVFCYAVLFAFLFCLCAWIYYHGFYTGYYNAYSDCKNGSIDSKDNERFEKKYNSQNHLPFVKP